MAETWNKYALTKARTHGKPGPQVRPKSVTIDMHAHISVPRAIAFAKPHMDPMTIPLFKYATDQSRAINAKQDVDRTPNMVKPYDLRLKDMDAQGVDMQLIMPPPPTAYPQLPIDIADKAIKLVNEEMAEYVAGKPDRFCALGHVPMQDGQAAAAELERIMKQYKFKGVQILTNTNGKELSDPQSEPFWKKAEELGAVVLLHPNGFTQGDRFTKHYFSNIIGNPFDSTMALHHLIFDGVFERYPKLKVVSVHGGGYLSAYSGRIDHAWGARADVNVVPLPPTTYLKRNVWVDTVVFTNHQLETLVRVFGPDHVVLGTDYPYDMAEEDPVGHVCNANLDDSAKAAICGLNAKNLLGL